MATNHDNDAENEGVSATAALTGQTANADSSLVDNFAIVDDETQAYSLSLDPTVHTRAMPPTEGGNISVVVRAVPGHVDDDAVIQLHVVDAAGQAARGYRVDGDGSPGDPMPSTVTVGNDDGTVANMPTILVTTPSIADDEDPGDGNRVTDTVTLRSFTGSAGSSAPAGSLDIQVLDVHGLPVSDAITAEAEDEQGNEVNEVVEGGDPVYLTVTVDRGVAADRTTSEELTVTIRPADPAQGGDYELTGTPITFSGGSGTGEQTSDLSVEIELSARGEDDDVGDEVLVLNLVVSGETGKGTETSTGTFPITIVDKTTKQVAPKTLDVAYPKIMNAMNDAAGDDGLNPGESFEVKTDDLFTVTEGYTATYGASVEGGGVNVGASGDTITVDAISATDGEVKVTVTATAKMAGNSFIPTQTTANVASITFPVTVVDKPLVVTVAADPAEIMEGGTSTITATANRAVQAGDGAVEIDLELVGDAMLDADSIMIAAGAMSGSAMLTATEDDDDYQDGTVTVIASGPGINGTMQVAIAVTDNDVEPEPGNTIEPKSEDEAYPVITSAIEGAAGDDGLNPGESFSVMASALFTVMDGYTASYSASVDGDAATASASGDSVTVTAAAAGAAKVTITGTSKMASSSFLPEQVATNVADITFEVMVVDKPLAALVVTLGMPANVMDGNIVEGESYDIVVSANRMVTEDTEVMIMRDRAASDAGEDDFTVSSATIMAGYDSATAELMVTEDMLPDSGTDDNMGEALVLFGMVNGEQTNALTFTIWDTAVPALPLFGQLLLALFLMLGGARLYRRRQG